MKKILNISCSTHPHQLYFEFLAEHGIVGTVILIFILSSLMLSKIKIILSSKNYLQLGCLTFLLTSFIPLLPSGAFLCRLQFNYFLDKLIYYVCRWK